MKLYHYNKTSVDILKTKRLQGSLPQKEVEEAEVYAKLFQLPGSYIDHISFFFDPIPSALLGTLYGDFHPIWFNGNTIVEHIVDSNMLDKDIVYRVVESPDKLAYLDSLKIEDSEEWLKKYFIALNEIQKQNGELGKLRSDLNRQIKKFQGNTEFYYQQSKTRIDWERNKLKYAACVPHLMLYPKSGTIPIQEWNQLTIGSKTRTHLEQGASCLSEHIEVYP